MDMFSVFFLVLIKSFLVKTALSSYYLKLSLHVFLKFFSFLPNFNFMCLIGMFLVEKRVL